MSSKEKTDGCRIMMETKNCSNKQLYIFWSSELVVAQEWQKMVPILNYSAFFPKVKLSKFLATKKTAM